jgi:hypothetical protein
VYYTSSTRNFALFTLWARPNKRKTIVAGELGEELLDGSANVFETIMGPEGWYLKEVLPPSTATKFATKLERLFDNVETI